MLERGDINGACAQLFDTSQWVLWDMEKTARREPSLCRGLGSR